MTKGLFVALCNAVDGRDDELDKWYNDQHIPEILHVPGILSVTRTTFSDVELFAGCRLAGYRYLTMYEIDANDDEGFERVAQAIRTAFTEGDSQKVAEHEFGEGEVSSALDLVTLREMFAKVTLKEYAKGASPT